MTHLSLTLNSGMDVIGKLFECPVCFDTILPPIRLCQEGHSVCDQCAQKVPACPLCRNPLNQARNRIAEGFLDNCLIKCKYHEDGCTTSLPGRKLAEHVKVCDYRPLNCIICKSKIPASEFMRHLEIVEDLELHFLQDGIVDVDFQVGGGDDNYYENVLQPRWISAFNHNFFCHLDTEELVPKWLIWVSFLGTAEECEEFYCAITVRNPEKQMEVTHVGKVHPIRSDKEDVRDSGNYLAIHDDAQAMNFLNEATGSLKVFVRISRRYEALCPFNLFPSLAYKYPSRRKKEELEVKKIVRVVEDLPDPGEGASGGNPRCSVG